MTVITEWCISAVRTFLTRTMSYVALPTRTLTPAHGWLLPVAAPLRGMALAPARAGASQDRPCS
jgi:hypothetical protein